MLEPRERKQSGIDVARNTRIISECHVSMYERRASRVLSSNALPRYRYIFAKRNKTRGKIGISHSELLFPRSTVTIPPRNIIIYYLYPTTRTTKYKVPQSPSHTRNHNTTLYFLLCPTFSAQPSLSCLTSRRWQDRYLTPSPSTYPDLPYP